MTQFKEIAMRHIEGLLCILLFVAADAAAPQPLFAQTDWPSYGHDPGGQRYSPLAQVNTQNVTKLKLAWRYGVGGKEVTPLVAGGLMYYSLPAGDFVAALKPETGKEEWKYDLGAGAPLRGVAYWPGDGQNPARIIAGSSDGRLTALNARTGRPIPGFGVEGWVNLKVGVADKFPEIKYQMSSPSMTSQAHSRTSAPGTSARADWSGPSISIRIRTSSVTIPGPRVRGSTPHLRRLGAQYRWMLTGGWCSSLSVNPPCHSTAANVREQICLARR
jgi:hypothetical protein